jgi:hypothetical protein
MKPTPPHHKTTAVTLRSVAAGYGGTRTLRVDGRTGRWIIVAARLVDAENTPPPGYVYVIVAPYTRGAGT